MELETYLALGVLGVGVAAWAIKKYQTVMADGKITLDEIVDVAEGIAEKTEETKKEIDNIVKED